MRDSGNGCVSTSIMCNGSCADVKRDTDNCGSCGNVCSAGMKCDNGKCARVSGFAFRKIFYGDTDRQGTPTADAWRKYGRNIDGVVSTGEPTDPTIVCKPAAGAPSANHQDGESGIDNSFGKNILPLLTQLVASPSTTASAAFEDGARTNMIEIYNWQGTLEEGQVGSRFWRSEKLGTARWDGTDIRDSVPLPHLPTTGQAFTSWIEAGLYSAPPAKSGGSISFHSLDLDLAIGASTMTITLQEPNITMRLSSNVRDAAEGVISGFIEVSKLEEEITKLVGSYDKNLCAGPSLDAIKQAIHQAADVLADGGPNPEQECDAISVGIGFEASLVVVGRKRTTDPPAPDPCAQ